MVGYRWWDYGWANPLGRFRAELNILKISFLCAFHLHLPLWHLGPFTASSLYGSSSWNSSDSVSVVLADVLFVSYLTLSVVFPTWISPFLPRVTTPESPILLLLLFLNPILLSQQYLNVSYIILLLTHANCDHDIAELLILISILKLPLTQYYCHCYNSITCYFTVSAMSGVSCRWKVWQPGQETDLTLSSELFHLSI